MKHDDLRPDHELHDMLRRFDAAQHPKRDERAALLRRISADAEPLLALRRPSAPAWWELTAGWARMLIPLGVATAVTAAAFIVWTAHVRPLTSISPMASQDSLVGSVAHDRTSQHLLDVILSTPAPTPDAAATPAPRGHE